ncbi:PilW family protein [Aquisalimonas lutea]|uniref:PilW family protein n=1 Tax=Aquisalimonas lutea TaxID=1327750 RepID=UPI0025B3D689|nr:PilW family protein [Aquisalimonas lutea]MDN3517457.1 PilW family protein [Aquisalimonas lutea]
MTTVQSVRSRQSGFSLVEIMVGITISLILLAGVLQIFNSSRQSYRVQEASSRIQENGRFAMAFLARDLRMAGYAGCMQDAPVDSTLNNSSSTLWDFDVGIEGFDDVGASLPSRLNVVDTDIEEGTDVVIIRRMAGSPVRITKNNNSAQLFAEVTGVEDDACPDDTDRVSGLCQNDIVMVSDCSKSRVFQITNLQTTGGGSEVNVVHSASGDPGNAESSWGGSSDPEEEQFGQGAELHRMETIIYFIGDGIDGPGLFRKVADGDAEELVPGIRDMQLRYGVDTNGDRSINAFRDAGSVSDWENVMSARAEFLTYSQRDFLADDPVSLNYDGGTFSAPDQRLYRVFETTATLRNRAP